MRYVHATSIALGAAIAALTLACTETSRSFDASDFERGAGFPLPLGAQVLKAETRNWDGNGDHDACAVVKVSQAEYDKIQAVVDQKPSVGPRPALIACSDSMYSEFARYAAGTRQYSSMEGGLARELVLVKNQPILLVQVSSW